MRQWDGERRGPMQVGSRGQRRWRSCSRRVSNSAGRVIGPEQTITLFQPCWGGNHAYFIILPYPLPHILLLLLLLIIRLWTCPFASSFIPNPLIRLLIYSLSLFRCPRLQLQPRLQPSPSLALWFICYYLLAPLYFDSYVLLYTLHPTLHHSSNYDSLFLLFTSISIQRYFSLLLSYILASLWSAPF